MTVAELLTMLRNNTATASNVTDAVLVDFLNIAYHTMENEIVSKVNEDFFYEDFTTDVVADQQEYSLEPSSSSSVGVKKVKSLEIKRASTDTYKSLLRKDDAVAGGYSRDRTDDNSTTSTGFYELKDSSVFIYPTPANDITDGLKMQAIVNLSDLEVADTEASIFPGHTELRQYHYMIALGAEPRVYRYKKLKQEAIESQQEFDVAVQKMLSNLTDRVIAPTTMNLPSGSRYK